MQSPINKRNLNSPNAQAESSTEKPGIYLIALRAHLNQGKTLIGDVLDSVANAFPQPPRLGTIASQPLPLDLQES
jgi:hypothetical protein